MAVKQPPWFVVERAEALAIIYLTSRDDLEVIPTARQRYDLLVRINDTRPAAEPRFFAVETRGMERRAWQASRNGELVFPVEYTSEQISGEGLPVCTFLFMVDEEDGYYRWLFEPVVNGNDLAELRRDPEIPRLREAQDTLTIRKQLEFAPLNDEAINSIVKKVASWYEARRDNKNH